MIAMNNFQAEYEFLKKELNSAVNNVLSSGNYILGENVTGFEKKFASYVGVKFAIGVGNGMEALQIALIAAGISQDDEVITAPLSAVATTLAITSIGAKPVFVDIDDYYHIDARKIEKAVTKKTKAILPVHLFGQSVDLVAIKKLCKKYNLILIEDAAQAHGALYQGKKLGSFGNAAAFSFYPTKNLGTYGDGGLIVTNNSTIKKRCDQIRNYGQKSRYLHIYKGLNSRLDEIHAAILKVKLKYLDIWNKQRQQIAKLYDTLLADVDEVSIPKIRQNANHVYHLYIIRSKKRDQLMDYLKTNQVISLIHYPIPIHKQPCYREFNHLSLPIAERYCREILSLPINPFLWEKEIETICQLIKRFFETPTSLRSRNFT